MSSRTGNGSGNGRTPQLLLWQLQGLLRRREAESVRDRVEELLEEPARTTPTGAATTTATAASTRMSASLLANVLRLRDKTAYDVMLPRADIMAMPEDLTLDQAISADPARGPQPLPGLSRQPRRHRRHGPHQGRLRRRSARDQAPSR